MTREEYRAHPALNFSLAKHLLDSPAHFRAAQDEEREETDAMRVGTIAHAMILEGKNLLDLYAIKPAGMSFATKDGKAWRDAQRLPILKEEDAEGIPRMAEAIAANPVARVVLGCCVNRETPILFTMHGVECKALLDCDGVDIEGRHIIADFKTAADASPGAFERRAIDMHYDMQAAWYCDGLALVNGLEVAPWWAWITAEKKAPFANYVLTPSDAVLESGRRKVRAALELYKSCVQSGEWPMPSPGPHTVNLPAWARKEAA